MEFELCEWTPLQETESRLREQFPDGLELVSLSLPSGRKMACAEAVAYTIAPVATLRGDARLEPEALQELMACESIPVERIRKKRKKVVNIRPFVVALQREGENIILDVKAGPQGSSRPEEILGALGFDDETCRSDFSIVRSRVQLTN